MKTSEETPQEIESAQPFFGIWRAPLLPQGPSEDGAEVVQNNEEHQIISHKSLVHPLARVLLSAQDTVKRLTSESIGLREENARICEGRRQVEEENAHLRERCCTQREESAARLSAAETHHRDRIGEMERDAALKVKETEEKWQKIESQLVSELKEQRSLVSSLTDKIEAVTVAQANTLTLLNQEKEREKELEKMWLTEQQKLWQTIGDLQEEMRCCKEENNRIQLNVSKALDELKSVTQAKDQAEGGRAKEINVSLQNDLRVQKEESAARLSDVEKHCTGTMEVMEENAAMKWRESEEKWQRIASEGKEMAEVCDLKSLLTEAKSHSQRMEEEMKEFKEELKRLSGENGNLREENGKLREGRRQAERENIYLRKDLHIQKEESAARLSDVEKRHTDTMMVAEGNSAVKLRESEIKWQRIVSQMEERMQQERQTWHDRVGKQMADVHELDSKLMGAQTYSQRGEEELRGLKEELRSLTGELRNAKALAESYRWQLAEKEECYQRRWQEMEKNNETERIWYKQELRQKLGELQEEIKCLPKESIKLQEPPTVKKRKPWWKKRIRFKKKRRRQRSQDTAVLMAQSIDE